jgi:hypothetical protein
MADEIPRYTKNSIVIGGDSDLYPPYSKERQDAELQVYRYALLSMAKLLHQKGLLDMRELREELSEGQVWFHDQARSLESLEWLLDTLDYMQAKLGPSAGMGEAEEDPE